MYNAPQKIDVIYRDHFVPEEGFKWEMDDDVKGLWNRVPRVDYVELRNYLAKKEIRISALDCAISEKPKIEDRQTVKRDKRISARTHPFLHYCPSCLVHFVAFVFRPCTLAKV